MTKIKITTETNDEGWGGGAVTVGRILNRSRHSGNQCGKFSKI